MEIGEDFEDWDWDWDENMTMELELMNANGGKKIDADTADGEISDSSSSVLLLSMVYLFMFFARVIKFAVFCVRRRRTLSKSVNSRVFWDIFVCMVINLALPPENFLGANDVISIPCASASILLFRCVE